MVGWLVGGWIHSLINRYRGNHPKTPIMPLSKSVTHVPPLLQQGGVEQEVQLLVLRALDAALQDLPSRALQQLLLVSWGRCVCVCVCVCGVCTRQPHPATTTPTPPPTDPPVAAPPRYEGRTPVPWGPAASAPRPAPRGSSAASARPCGAVVCGCVCVGGGMGGSSHKQKTQTHSNSHRCWGGKARAGSSDSSSSITTTIVPPRAIDRFGLAPAAGCWVGGGSRGGKGEGMV